MLIMFEDDDEESMTEEDFYYLLRRNPRELFYPHGRYYKGETHFTPRIMSFLGFWRKGFARSDKMTLNRTKSDFSRILKGFVGSNASTDQIFLVNYIRFFTKLFDIEEVREQMRVYISSPHTIKYNEIFPALEELKTLEYPLTLKPPQLTVLSEVLEMFRNAPSDSFIKIDRSPPSREKILKTLGLTEEKLKQIKKKNKGFDPDTVYLT